MPKKYLVLLFGCVFLFASVSFAGVTVTSPTSGATVGSPVQFVASASSGAPITAMRIYVDNVSVFLTSSNSINTPIALSAATHRVVVQAWDSTGAVFVAPAITVNVAGAAPTGGLPTPPAGAAAQSGIDQFAGWASCTTCAGAGGAGPTASFSMAQGQASPSIDGKSTKFNIAGTIPYSDALWWRQLGAVNTAKNFKYDVSFYLISPQLAQALEFDVNQSNGAHKFIFGTQCNLRNGGVWDVWANAAGNWVSTGVPCAVPTANTWHHLTWEFQRTDTNVVFVGFTLDGVTHIVNRSYPARASGANEMNVAFQMDGDYAMHAYSVWLDQVSLTYW